MAAKTNQQPPEIQSGKQQSPVDVKYIKKFEQLFEAAAPGLLKSIPQDKRPALMRASYQVTEMMVYHQGPLPDAETLARYGEIIPQGADRIMKMAENQSDHRIGLEKTVIASQQALAARGQQFGLAIGVIGILAAAYLAMNNHDTVAGVIGGTTVVSLAVAFITGRRVQQKELQEKRPQ